MLPSTATNLMVPGALTLWFNTKLVLARKVMLPLVVLAVVTPKPPSAVAATVKTPPRVEMSMLLVFAAVEICALSTVSAPPLTVSCKVMPPEAPVLSKLTVSNSVAIKLIPKAAVAFSVLPRKGSLETPSPPRLSAWLSCEIEPVLANSVTGLSVSVNPEIVLASTALYILILR